MRHRGRRPGLAQRMRARKGVVLHAAVVDARHGRKRLDVDLDVLRADHLAGEADVGERDAVAVAMAAGLLLVREVAFECAQRLGLPVPDPGRYLTLVELEGLAE